MNLPNAALKEEKGMDKLSFYDLAQKDSAQLAEQVKADPYLKAQDHLRNTSFSSSNEIERLTGQAASKFNQTSVTSGLRTTPYSVSKNSPEEEIMQKLSLLQKELNKPSRTKSAERINGKDGPSKSNHEFSSEVDRLEGMMQAMNSGAETDPEMKQLETTLDKMLDIQHPERVRERIKERSVKNKEKVYTLGKKPFQLSVSLLDTTGKRKSTTSRFYGLYEVAEANEHASAEAVVHESQTLVNGAVIKLRLLGDIYINGILIPAGAFVFGTVSLNGERLEVQINSVRYKNLLLPVKLDVYDLDGQPGIYVPGAITREVAKTSVDNAAQMLEITSLDPSLKAQATNAGLDAVKSLLSKKTKLVKVLVKAGYKVLLKDNTTGQ
jgi:conjugative transposon TraM protein